MNTLVDALRIYLASNFVLYLKTHFIHWNVQGMFFMQLHKMFEEQYQDLWENTDTIAEKVRELDSPVTLTPQDQIELSVIDPTQQLGSAKDHLTTLLADHQRMITLLNKVFAVAEQANDQAIMNYIAERLDAHAKMRWFIKATLTSVESR